MAGLRGAPDAAPRADRDPAWWVLGPASLIALAIVVLALSLRGMGFRIGGQGARVPPATPTRTPSPTATPLPSVWVAPNVPAPVAISLGQWVEAHPQACVMASSGEGASVRVDLAGSPGATLAWERVYVVAVPYFRQEMGVGSAALKTRWQRGGREGEVPLWLTGPGGVEVVTALLGPRGPGVRVEEVAWDQLAERAWTAAEAWVVIPFDRLVPPLRPLPVDGTSVLDPSADMSRYPLALRVWVQGPADLVEPLVEAVRAEAAPTNRDPARLGTVAVTGVTAMTRMTAVRMDQQGDPGYPAREVGPLLSQADVTHVSNEVPFAEGCQPQQAMSAFCSRPAYTETLRLLGADVVELTGNHILDLGPEALLDSLQWYEEGRMAVFGGGRDEEEARRPLVVEVQGTTVAFLGYNQAGPPEVWATAQRPGAGRFDLERARQEIEAARAQADVVMVHVQHAEAYSVHPTPRQRLDFLALTEAGADVVVGTQAHQPQAVEFHRGKLILYGLGNLIFDQMWSVPTRQSLVAWHVLYDGRHLATELLPTRLEDYAQPRWLRGAEAQEVLDEVFAASYWGSP